MGKSKHDYFKQECPKNEPEEIATHSNGTVFYRCKNCNYFGPIDSFTNCIDVTTGVKVTPILRI